MAADAKEYDHRTDLFTKDGESVIFFLRPCYDKLSIKPYIEHGGGKITSKYVTGAIKLAQDSDHVSSDGYISTRYILDCARQDKLLDTESYTVKRQRFKKSVVENAEELSDVSDDLSPSSSVIMETRDIKGRSKYTDEEDKKMLTFIVDEGRIKGVHGMQLYKDMEILKITNHTASSMNTRMRKIILPNLKKYDIPNSWKKMLTSGLSPNTEAKDKAKKSLHQKSLFVTQNTQKEKKQMQESDLYSDGVEIESYVSEDEFDQNLKNIGKDSIKSTPLSKNSNLSNSVVNSDIAEKSERPIITKSIVGGFNKKETEEEMDQDSPQHCKLSGTNNNMKAANIKDTLPGKSSPNIKESKNILKRKYSHSATESKESRMTYVMEDENNEDIIPCETVPNGEHVQEYLTKLGEMFGLLDEEVVYLMKKHDGSVVETIRYIVTGKSSLTWDMADDKDLINNTHIDRLNKKYSEVRVLSRRAFLESV